MVCEREAGIAGNKMISKKLKRAIRLSPHRNYKIARAAGVHPSTLSQILCGIVRVKNGDPRVIQIGKVLGLKPGECFEEEK